LINPGKILLCAAIFVNVGIQSNATLLEAELDHEHIDVGESTTLRIKLSGDLAVMKPLKYPSVPGLKIEDAGMQQSFQMINGRSWSGVELLFTVTALKKGTYRIPGFVFQHGKETIRSRDVTLAVTGGSAPASGMGAGIIPSIEISSSVAYVGQPVIMRYFIKASGNKAELQYFEHIPDSRGFVIKRIDDIDSGASRSRQPENGKTMVASYALIPTGPGTFMVGGGDAVFLVENPMAGRARDFFGFGFPELSQTKTIAFETRTMTILPLPQRGMPDDFHGDIGKFVIRAEYDDIPVKIYQEKRVMVTLEGSGNLITLTNPMLEKEVDGLKTISQEGENSIKIDGSNLTGTKKFIFTLIPEKSGTVDAGRFKFSFFDPQKGAYETVRSGNISFTAKNDESRALSGFDKDTDTGFDFNPLYFVFIVLALAGIIVFVIVWERKRLAVVSGNMNAGEESFPDENSEKKIDYQADCAGCLRNGDGEFFLNLAEKWIDQLLKEYGDSVVDGTENKIYKIRSEIHQFKFGGGTITPEDMKRIYGEITAVR
jgi:hypothetical protein